MFKTTLPPKNGYVEVVDANGEHVYVKTEELLQQEKVLAEKDLLLQDIKLKDARISALSASHDFLEECIVEMATLLYP